MLDVNCNYMTKPLPEMRFFMKTIKSIIPNPVFKYNFPYNLDEIAFFDIETTGLSPKVSSLYLIGMMYYDNDINSWTLIQWFADNYKSEAEIINSFFSLLLKYKYLYHFNGRTFDIPHIRNKCQKHNIKISDDIEKILNESIDILASVRPIKKLLSIEKANQTFLERWLDIIRDDTYNGGELIAVYSEYMQKKIMSPEESVKLEEILLLHNHDDIAQMLNVCSIMSYYDFLTSDNQINITSVLIDEDAMLQISFDVSYTFPKRVTITKPFPENKSGVLTDIYATLVLDNNTVFLSVPVLEGTLMYFMKDYKNYYYMPSNDVIIHKSVINSEEKKLCRKATAATCHIKKEGIFIPSLTLRHMNDTANIFYIEHKDKVCFYELPDVPFDINDTFFRDYALLQISGFTS